MADTSKAATQLEHINGFSEHEPLAPFSTFKIGGPADILVRPKKLEELQEVAQTIIAENISYAILGGGSNVLIADQGFRGIVIIPDFSHVKITGERVQVGAHVGLQKLIHTCIDAGLAGIEHLAGIPGSVGGAVVGNAGTSAHWIQESIESVTTVNMKSAKAETFSNADCGFGYRTSKFKDTSEWCVIDAAMHLHPDDPSAIRKRMQEQILTRSHQPTGSASAGCIFKNPKDQSAGKLIEQCGLKGKKIGGAMVSHDHANFIINTGTATAEDVIILISFIKQQVRDTLGIQLQEEVRTLGI